MFLKLCYTRDLPGERSGEHSIKKTLVDKKLYFTDAHEVDSVVREIAVTKPSYKCEGQTTLHGLNVNDPNPKLVVAHKIGDEPKRGKV